MLSQPVDIQILRYLLGAPSLYIGSAVTIFIVTFLYFFCRNEHKLSIPIYKGGDGNAETLKKRWMFDAINLLNEGYAKV
jgi:hypothetical protein